MMRRRRMRWSDVPEGFRRLCRDPSNLAGIGIGLAAGTLTYYVSDTAANYAFGLFQGVSPYSHLNEFAGFMRDAAWLGEIALSGYVAWKADHGARDFARRRF